MSTIHTSVQDRATIKGTTIRVIRRQQLRRRNARVVPRVLLLCPYEGKSCSFLWEEVTQLSKIRSDALYHEALFQCSHCWKRFGKPYQLKRHQTQRPKYCMDGRKVDEPLSQSDYERLQAIQTAKTYNEIAAIAVSGKQTHEDFSPPINTTPETQTENFPATLDTNHQYPAKYVHLRYPHIPDSQNWHSLGLLREGPHNPTVSNNWQTPNNWNMAVDLLSQVQSISRDTNTTTLFPWYQEAQGSGSGNVFDMDSQGFNGINSYGSGVNGTYGQSG